MEKTVVKKKENNGFVVFDRWWVFGGCEMI